MAWIQVDDGIREHDKIYNLADTLGISNAHAVGLMVCFWTWAVTSAPDGDVTSFPPRAITKAAGWDKGGAKGAKEFYDALLSIRFLEKREDSRILIRNWEQRATLLIDYIEQQKENTRKRVQKCRDRKKQKQPIPVAPKSDESVTPSNGDCNVTETLSNGTTSPNLKVPIPKSTVSKLSDNNNPLPPTEESTAKSERRDLAIVGEAFENGVKDIVSSHDSETLLALINAYSVSQVLSAIEEAKKCKGHSAAYVQRVLEGWERDGKSPPGKPSGPDLTDPDRYKNFGK